MVDHQTIIADLPDNLPRERWRFARQATGFVQRFSNLHRVETIRLVFHVLR